MIKSGRDTKFERNDSVGANMGSVNNCDCSSARLYYEADNFFFRDARLCVGDAFADIRALQTNLKIRISNNGKRQALNCKATFRVIIPAGADSSLYPTGNDYDVSWSRKPDLSDLAESIMINPKDRNEVVIVFCNVGFAEWSEARVASGNMKQHRYAQIATVPHVKNISLWEEDSFSEGDFVGELTISWHGGNKRKLLMIHIVKDFRKCSIRKLSFFEGIRLKFLKHV